MNRAEKAAEIESLKAKFSRAQLAILADYKGLSVAAMTDLRRKLRTHQTSLKVVKNRLAKIAVKGTDADYLVSHFVGTTIVALSEGDPAAAAKVLSDFQKDNEKFKLKVGLLTGKALDLNALKALASMPSREQLIAKLMGSMNAPASNLVSVLSQIPRQLVTVLSAIRDQKQ